MRFKSPPSTPTPSSRGSPDGWNIRRRDSSHPSFEDATGNLSGGWFTDLKIAREPGLPNVFGMADGTHFPVEEPADDDIQNAYYNGWKSACYVTNIFCFGPDGAIFYALTNAPGLPRTALRKVLKSPPVSGARNSSACCASCGTVTTTPSSRAALVHVSTRVNQVSGGGFVDPRRNATTSR